MFPKLEPLNELKLAFWDFDMFLLNSQPVSANFQTYDIAASANSSEFVKVLLRLSGVIYDCKMLCHSSSPVLTLVEFNILCGQKGTTLQIRLLQLTNVEVGQPR